MSLKVAIIGCGKIADAHVEEIRKVGCGATVIAVCDRERLMAEQLASRYAIDLYFDSVAEMLDRTKPDVVHITTPPQSHLALARQALAAGCHLYVEKPLAMNLEESQALLAEVARANKKMTLGWEYLFDPPALRLRQLVAEGVIGTPVHVDSCFGYSLKGPFGAAIFGDPNHWVHKLSGKLFHNIIDHVLNKYLEYIDDESPSVIASGYRLNDVRTGDGRDHVMDELRIMVRGSRVSGFGLFSSHARPVGHFYRLYGTKNTAHVDLVGRTVTLDATTRLPSALGRLGPAFEQAMAYGREAMNNVSQFIHSEFDYFTGLRHLLARFYSSIEQDTPLPISYRDMLRVSAMMDEVFRQVPQRSHSA